MRISTTKLARPAGDGHLTVRGQPPSRPSLRVAGRLSGFVGDEYGTVSVEMLLVLGLVSIPIILFLVNFSIETVDWVKSKSPAIFEEADSLIGG